MKVIVLGFVHHDSYPVLGIDSPILSSTGFIGFPVAQALVRAGHVVYGQTRSDSKYKQLAEEESTSCSFRSSETDANNGKSHPYHQRTH